jgi:dienelactone hydrolase
VVKASVFAHPSFLVKEEAAQIHQPILFLCAEKDPIFVPDLREHFEKVLTPTGLATFIDFPGTTHGFVVRPDGSEQEEHARDKAVQDAIEFFKKNI